MSRRLILMRHAKSSWSVPLTEDHARKLNGRGRVSAQVLSDWLRARRYLPDQALVSDAARTRETFARLRMFCDTRFDPTLYHASTPAMMTALRAAAGRTVLMVGHNPGIAEFAELLVVQPPHHERFFDYPTGATTVMDFDIDGWDSLAAGTGHVADFIIPREITG